MKIICGLGNPGKKFEKTRHNLGFLILDFFAKKEKFPKFKLEKEFQAKISKKGEIILAKPQTFMNNSGKAIKALTDHYKLKTENLIVVHDDIDLPFGKIKISFGKGSGGHKGVQSIINELKTKDFLRVRVGICPQKKPKKVDEFVLSEFDKRENEILKKVIEGICKALKIALEKGIEKAMQEFNKKN